jgi:hypothetical protein
MNWLPCLFSKAKDLLSRAIHGQIEQAVCTIATESPGSGGGCAEGHSAKLRRPAQAWPRPAPAVAAGARSWRRATTLRRQGRGMLARAGATTQPHVEPATPPAACARCRALGPRGLQRLRARHAPVPAARKRNGHVRPLPSRQRRGREICSGVHAGTGIAAYMAAIWAPNGRHGGHAATTRASLRSVQRRQLAVPGLQPWQRGLQPVAREFGSAAASRRPNATSCSANSGPAWPSWTPSTPTPGPVRSPQEDPYPATVSRPKAPPFEPQVRSRPYAIMSASQAILRRAAPFGLKYAHVRASVAESGEPV